MQKAIIPRRIGLLFMLPALTFVAVFLVYPFISVFMMSFTNQALVGANALNPQNVGLQNYVTLFDPDTWMRRGELGHSLFITAQFVIGSALIGQAILGMAIAVAFHRRKGIRREFVFGVAIMAWIIPDVVVAFAWFAFLNPDGTLNQMLGLFGINGMDWLFKYPLLSIIVFNTWRGTAFSMLLFSSALSSIPPSYMETADVIGASAWQKFRDILFPLLQRYIATDLILITLWTFNTFGPYLITGGGPTYATNIIAIHTYKVGLRDFQFGEASAIAMVVLLINLTLASVYLFFLRSRKGKTA